MARIQRAAAWGIKPIPIRVLVDAEKGLSGVLPADGSKPTISVPAAAGEEAAMRASMEFAQGENSFRYSD
jgi:hypothetical protein